MSGKFASNSKNLQPWIITAIEDSFRQQCAPEGSDNLLTELTGSITISRLESAGPPMSNNTSNEKDSKHGVIK
jgi:hypothetical protein